MSNIFDGIIEKSIKGVSKKIKKENELVNQVFLGGTCNNSEWRNELIKKLKIPYFNPVVKDWTPECQAEEIKQRDKSKFNLYVITPKMTGVYSIAEVVEDAIKKPDKTIFCLLDSDEKQEFNQHQLKSLMQVGKMVERNGAKFFTNLNEVANHLNKGIK